MIFLVNSKAFYQCVLWHLAHRECTAFHCVYLSVAFGQSIRTVLSKKWLARAVCAKKSAFLVFRRNSTA